MSWQEDLRRIDAALAAGKLSKEQYAVKREELLAEASSATSQRDEPASEVPVRTPPPVPAKDLLTTDRQTTAPSPADENSTDSLPHPPRPQPQPKPAGVQPGELPPPVPAKPAPRPTSSAPKQPPHRVDIPPPEPPRERPNGTVRTWLFLGLGLLVVAGLIAAGLWWLVADDTPAGDGDNAHPPPSVEPADPTTTAPTTTGKPELIDQLPELPGVLNRNSGSFAPDEGAERKLYGTDEALLLKRQGVKRVTWKGSSRNVGKAQMAYVILVADNASGRKAEETADVLRNLSESRVPAAEGLPGFKNLPTFRKISEKANIYRVIYTSGRKTVRVGVVQQPGTDAKRLSAELSDLLEQVTAVLPPNGS